MAPGLCVFDAYGTLFDVAAPARRLAAARAHEGFAAVWPQIAEDWRRKQLEYSWLRAITGDHVPFDRVTEDGLDWALARAGLGEDAALRADLLDLYRTLDAYPEVPGMLGALREAGCTTAILSNGSPAMLEAAVTAAGIGPRLDAVLSVETAGIFKPARAVYDLVGQQFGTPPQSVLFVSSNGWDVAGAAAYGFRTVWVNRRGDPRDRLPGTPDHELGDLTGLADLRETL